MTSVMSSSTQGDAQQDVSAKARAQKEALGVTEPVLTKFFAEVDPRVKAEHVQAMLDDDTLTAGEIRRKSMQRYGKDPLDGVADDEKAHAGINGHGSGSGAAAKKLAFDSPGGGSGDGGVRNGHGIGGVGGGGDDGKNAAAASPSHSTTEDLLRPRSPQRRSVRWNLDHDETDSDDDDHVTAGRRDNGQGSMERKGDDLPKKRQLSLQAEKSMRSLMESVEQRTSNQLAKMQMKLLQRENMEAAKQKALKQTSVMHPFWDLKFADDDARRKGSAAAAAAGSAESPLGEKLHRLYETFTGPKLAREADANGGTVSLDAFLAGFDVDRNGTLDRGEFTLLLRSLGWDPALMPRRARMVARDKLEHEFQRCDTGRSGVITFDEFKVWLGLAPEDGFSPVAGIDIDATSDDDDADAASAAPITPAKAYRTEMAKFKKSIRETPPRSLCAIQALLERDIEDERVVAREEDTQLTGALGLGLGFGSDLVDEDSASRMMNGTATAASPMVARDGLGSDGGALGGKKGSSDDALRDEEEVVEWSKPARGAAADDPKAAASFGGRGSLSTFEGLDNVTRSMRAGKCECKSLPDSGDCIVS